MNIAVGLCWISWVSSVRYPAVAMDVFCCNFFLFALLFEDR